MKIDKVKQFLSQEEEYKRQNCKWRKD